MIVRENVRAVLDRATPVGHVLRLPAALDRDLYEAVNKVLVAAGGRWNRKQQGHVFTDQAADVVEALILTGTVTSKRQVLGFFETPPAVVRQILAAADIERHHEVLEPSAGRGAIAGPAADIAANITCVEIDPDHHDALCGAVGPRATIWRADFLQWPIAAIYDRIVMNPPFARQADIHHVTRALQFLRPGGRLVAVMSAGATFRENPLSVRFRALLTAAGATVETLPALSFMASGTAVNTVLVTARYAPGLVDHLNAGPMRVCGGAVPQ